MNLWQKTILSKVGDDGSEESGEGEEVLCSLRVINMMNVGNYRKKMEKVDLHNGTVGLSRIWNKNQWLSSPVRNPAHEGLSALLYERFVRKPASERNQAHETKPPDKTNASTHAMHFIDLYLLFSV